MTPPKFGSLGQYVQVTQQGQMRKERMRDPKNIIEIKDITTFETESIILTRVEEETSTMAQGEVGQSFGTRDDILNPNPETPTKPDEMKGQQQGHDEEEVLVEEITNQADSEGEEDDIETAEVGPFVVRKKIKVKDTTDITLPYLPDTVVTVDDMLRKLPKLR
jgi:hypothetical protein